MRAVSLVLADDHPIVLRGLCDLFASEPGFRVLAGVSTANDALQAVQEHRPDVLVLDMRLPDRDGLAVLRDLRAARTPTRVVILSAHVDEHAVIDAVRLGAAGVVLKDSPPADVVECVRQVAEGHAWFDRQVVAGSLTKAVQQSDAWREARAMLTERELDVIRMVSQGLRNRAIASTLGVTEGTVKVHLHNIFKKLHLQNRVELVRYAQQHRLV